jgi:hypothetical protein
MGTFSILTLPADNGTWAVALVTSSGDQVLKRMRDPDLWTAVIEACPLHAHWLQGERVLDLLEGCIQPGQPQPASLRVRQLSPIGPAAGEAHRAAAGREGQRRSYRVARAQAIG